MADDNKPWWQPAADWTKNLFRLATGGPGAVMTGVALDKASDKIVDAVAPKPQVKEASKPADVQKVSATNVPSTVPAPAAAEPSFMDQFNNLMSQASNGLNNMATAGQNQLNGLMQSLSGAANSPLLAIFNAQNLKALSTPHPEIDAEIAAMPDRAEFEKFKGGILAGLLPGFAGGGDSATDATKQALSGAADKAGELAGKVGEFSKNLSGIDITEILNKPGFNALALKLYQNTKDLQGPNAISSFGIPVIKHVATNILSIFGDAWQKASALEGNFGDKIKAFFSALIEGIKAAAVGGMEEAVTDRADKVGKDVQALGFDQNAANLMRGIMQSKVKEKMPDWLKPNTDTVPAAQPQQVAQTVPAIQPKSEDTTPYLPPEIQNLFTNLSSNIKGAQSANTAQAQITPAVIQASSGPAVPGIN